MDKSIFRTDLFIGCPFDDSEMELVESHGNLKLGCSHTFTHADNELTGEVVAIGKNAKYLDGTPFTALIILVNGYHYQTKV